MTVSRALKNDAPISQRTRQRVLAAVKRVGYVPDLNARVFASRRSGFIAALVPSLNNSNFADTVGGMSEVFDLAGLQMLLGDTEYSLTREELLLSAFLQRRPEAIILTGGVHSKLSRQLLFREGFHLSRFGSYRKSRLDTLSAFRTARPAPPSFVISIVAGASELASSEAAASEIRADMNDSSAIGKQLRAVCHTPDVLCQWGSPQRQWSRALTLSISC